MKSDKKEQSGKNIMWLEDVPKSISANVFLLESAGFSVTVAKTLAEGVEAARRAVFDVFFVDYSVPENSEGTAVSGKGVGMEFIHMIRTGVFGPVNAKARIILCTAQRESISRERDVLDEYDVEILAKAKSYNIVSQMAR